jgi:hypothetical protein
MVFTGPVSSPSRESLIRVAETCGESLIKVASGAGRHDACAGIKQDSSDQLRLLLGQYVGLGHGKPAMIVDDRGANVR